VERDVRRRRAARKTPSARLARRIMRRGCPGEGLAAERSREGVGVSDPAALRQGGMTPSKNRKPPPRKARASVGPDTHRARQRKAGAPPAVNAGTPRISHNSQLPTPLIPPPPLKHLPTSPFPRVPFRPCPTAYQHNTHAGSSARPDGNVAEIPADGLVLEQRGQRGRRSPSLDSAGPTEVAVGLPACRPRSSRFTSG